ncbi:MAG TPA: hypothetical protein DCL21_01960 [Alphaproteobacteria bacterium]|nr:hypothetical protein [Alphaproteobacteria bacterium]
MVTANVTDTTITSTSATSTTSGTSKDKNQAIADFDTFLQLLTAQLANQDPLNPQDGTEFTSQLAQFSSLEQQINTNEYLEALVKAQPDTKQTEAMSYIGKEILVPGNKFALKETGNIEFSYDSNQPLESVKVTVYDSSGEKVHDFNAQAEEGIHEVLWDGRDAEGNRLPSDIYSIKVEGQSIKADGSTSTTPLTSYFYAEAEKVTKLGSTYSIMTSDGRSTELDDILAARSVSENDGTDSSKHATALQMLGKEILIPGSEFAYSGNDKSFTYGLSKDAQAVKVTIKDEDGNRIKEVPFEASAGNHEFVWDGTDSAGNKVDAGNYTIEIKAENTAADGKIESERLDTFFYGTAEKVETAGDIVLIYTADGRKAFYEEVISTKK